MPRPALMVIDIVDLDERRRRSSRTITTGVDDCRRDVIKWVYSPANFRTASRTTGMQAVQLIIAGNGATN